MKTVWFSGLQLEEMQSYAGEIASRPHVSMIFLRRLKLLESNVKGFRERNRFQQRPRGFCDYVVVNDNVGNCL